MTCGAGASFGFTTARGEVWTYREHRDEDRKVAIPPPPMARVALDRRRHVPQPIAPAIALAACLHAGQVDKAGQPYIGHLAPVALILQRRFPTAEPAEIEAAWLHDALEDTPATPTDLFAAGVSSRAVAIVQALTRPGRSNYLDWICDLAAAGDQSVIRVKLVDNEDNREPARVAALPGAAERVERRYKPARQLLEAALVG